MASRTSSWRPGWGRAAGHEQAGGLDAHRRVRQDPGLEAEFTGLRGGTPRSWGVQSPVCFSEPVCFLCRAFDSMVTSMMIQVC